MPLPNVDAVVGIGEHKAAQAAFRRSYEVLTRAKEDPPKTWVRGCDGGDRYWGIEYDVGRGTFDEFRANSSYGPRSCIGDVPYEGLLPRANRSVLGLSGGRESEVRPALAGGDRLLHLERRGRRAAGEESLAGAEQHGEDE